MLNVNGGGLPHGAGLSNVIAKMVLQVCVESGVQILKNLQNYGVKVLSPSTYKSGNKLDPNNYRVNE